MGLSYGKNKSEVATTLFNERFRHLIVSGEINQLRDESQRD